MFTGDDIVGCRGIKVYRFFIFLIIVATSISVEAGENDYLDFFNTVASKLVAEYRLPIDSDMKNEWKMKEGYPYKTTDGSGMQKAPFWTSGDFNGDGKVDYAYILIHRNGNKKQLFAFISEGSNYLAFLLGEASDYEMGLATQNPGELLTASGKGYWEPTPDDPPKVNIKNQAISYFMFESAASVFVWNDVDKSFKRHWISD